MMKLNVLAVMKTKWEKTFRGLLFLLLTNEHMFFRARAIVQDDPGNKN